MAIIGVRTSLKSTAQAVVGGTKTGLIWWMQTNTAKGQSSDLPAGSATNFLGKALNFVGNKGAAREIRVAQNDRN